MTKAQLIRHVMAETGLTESEARRTLDLVLMSVMGALLKDEQVSLEGLGTFSTRPRRKGMARNIHTGEAVPIPPGKAVRFTPDEKLIRVLTETDE